MSDISEVSILGVEGEIKDATARSEISDLKETIGSLNSQITDLENNIGE